MRWRQIEKSLPQEPSSPPRMLSLFLIHPLHAVNLAEAVREPRPPRDCPSCMWADCQKEGAGLLGKSVTHAQQEGWVGWDPSLAALRARGQNKEGLT